MLIFVPEKAEMFLFVMIKIAVYEKTG